MVFYKYYLEIKNRSLLLFLMWVTTVLAGYYCKEMLLFIIIRPIICYSKDDLYVYFIFTDATEIFSIFIKIILFFGNQVVIVYFIYHLSVFILPGLLRTEYSILKFFFKMIVSSFFVAVIFFNVFLLPLSWDFFLSFQEFVTMKSIVLYFEAKLNEYLKFYIEFYFICMFYCLAIVFFVFFFNRIKSDLSLLKKSRKPFYYVFFVISTLLTPPDVFSQIILSIFIIFGYELIFFSFVLKSSLKTLVW